MDSDSVRVPLQEAEDGEGRSGEECSRWRCAVCVLLVLAFVLVVALLALELESLAASASAASSSSTVHVEVEDEVDGGAGHLARRLHNEAHLFNFRPRCPGEKVWFRGKCRDVR